MRKIFLLITVIIITLCSCTEKGIEGDAMKHMKILMKETLNNPDNATLVNVHTTYKSDSLCVISFILKANNNQGNAVSIPIEYIYIDIPNFEGERLVAETATATGGNIISKIYNEGIGTEKDEDLIKECNDAGYDYEYLVNHSIFDIRDKYQNTLIKNAPYKANDPNIDDKLIFSAAWVKLMVHGRDVEQQEGKDIKL